MFDYITTSIEAVIALGHVTLVQYSWPCASLSAANHESLDEDNRWEDIERGLELLQVVLRYVDACKPRMVVLENVDTLLQLRFMPVLMRVETMLEPLSFPNGPYRWDYQVIKPHEHFADGIRRSRVWITGAMAEPPGG